MALAVGMAMRVTLRCVAMISLMLSGQPGRPSERALHLGVSSVERPTCNDLDHVGSLVRPLQSSVAAAVRAGRHAQARVDRRRDRRLDDADRHVSGDLAEDEVCRVSNVEVAASAPRSQSKATRRTRSSVAGCRDISEFGASVQRTSPRTCAILRPAGELRGANWLNTAVIVGSS